MCRVYVCNRNSSWSLAFRARIEPWYGVYFAFLYGESMKGDTKMEGIL